MDKGKQIIESTDVVLEERPTKPSPKRQRIMKEKGPHIEEYSPSQSLLRITEEHLTREKIQQLGSQGGIFIT